MLQWLKNLDWPLATRRFIFGTTIVVLLYDVLAAVFGGHGSTISLQGWCMIGGEHRGFREVSLEAAVFFLLGHIFGRVDSSLKAMSVRLKAKRAAR